MTNPKDALRVAEAYLKIECLNRKCSEAERELYQMIADAIPIAELHEALWNFVFTPSGIDIDDYGYDMDQFWPKIIELRKEMKALKCTPQK